MKASIPALLAVLIVIAAPARAAQEFSCAGPDTITGKAIGPTTLSVSGFACEGAPEPYNALGDRAAATASQTARRAPFVVVNFKAPAPAIKTGDMVTVKGKISVTLDPAQQMSYVTVDGAELNN